MSDIEETSVTSSDEYSTTTSMITTTSTITVIVTEAPEAISGVLVWFLAALGVAVLALQFGAVGSFIVGQESTLKRLKKVPRPALVVMNSHVHPIAFVFRFGVKNSFNASSRFRILLCCGFFLVCLFEIIDPVVETFVMSRIHKQRCPPSWLLSLVCRAYALCITHAGDMLH